MQRPGAAQPSQRSGSRQRQPSLPRPAIAAGEGRPRQVAGSACAGASPTDGFEEPADQPRSTSSAGTAVAAAAVGARPPQDPARVYSVNQAAEASRGRANRGVTPTRSNGRPVETVTRSNSRGRAAVGAAPRVTSTSDVTRSAVFGYLRLYGLNHYARAFFDLGFGELDAIARMSESKALEFLDSIRVYPGHRLRLLRAIDGLRHALQSSQRDAAQMLEDDAALDRLCAQNEELSKRRSVAEDEKQRLKEENTRLLEVVRQQDLQLSKNRDRIGELEELVESQTEQVNFLAQQLQMLAAADPKCESELYKSYRETVNDDWREAHRVELSDLTDLPLGAGAEALGPLPPENISGDQTPLVATRSSASEPYSDGKLVNPRGVRRALFDSPDRLSGGELGSPRGRLKFAKSLDSAKVKECLAGFDMNHITRCLATAIQNKLILIVKKPRPYVGANIDCLIACAIFLEPECHEKLMGTVSEGNGQLALGELLKDVAVRVVPNSGAIFGFLRDVMVNFRLEPEVLIITLVYLERFVEACGVALTPDNWQRLTITAMMLASKVWNDESFENAEFAQLCPLYTIEEINCFERIFLKCVAYDMSVKGSQYANMYFWLRTLGAKDCADFKLEPMDPQRASRLLERCLEKQLEYKERYPGGSVVASLNWTM